MAMEVDVAIVGGGMGGLALAVGLQERGIQAHVFEKSPKERRHFGTGISIGQNGMSSKLRIGRFHFRLSKIASERGISCDLGFLPSH
jgi:2-polyprenyl-6-methoxyphenol hydroxylase-like FAD-dependent oxidoreductase